MCGLRLHCEGSHSNLYSSHYCSYVLSSFCSAIPSGLFTPKDVDSLVQEVLKMHALSHPNVMPLTGVCLATGGGPAIVMPYMDNGSVLNYLKKERGKLVPPDDADCSVVSMLCACGLGKVLHHGLNIGVKLNWLTNPKLC